MSSTGLVWWVASPSPPLSLLTLLASATRSDFCQQAYLMTSSAGWLHFFTFLYHRWNEDNQWRGLLQHSPVNTSPQSGKILFAFLLSTTSRPRCLSHFPPSAIPPCILLFAIQCSMMYLKHRQLLLLACGCLYAVLLSSQCTAHSALLDPLFLQNQVCMKVP